jgi:hypothetical protein
MNHTFLSKPRRFVVDSIAEELSLFKKVKIAEIQKRVKKPKANLFFQKKDWEYLCGKYPKYNKSAIMEYVIADAHKSMSYLVKDIMRNIPGDYNKIGKKGLGRQQIEYALLPERQYSFYLLKEKLQERTGQKLSDSQCLLVSIAMVARKFRHRDGIPGNSSGLFDAKTYLRERRAIDPYFGSAKNGKVYKFSHQLNISLGVATASFCSLEGKLYSEDNSYGNVTSVCLAALIKLCAEMNRIDESDLETLKARAIRNAPKRAIKFTCTQDRFPLLDQIKNYVLEKFGVILNHAQCLKLAIVYADRFEANELVNLFISDVDNSLWDKHNEC